MSAAADLMSIFGEALDCASPAERAAYLDTACGGDAELRSRVEGLLRAHEKAGGFLRGLDKTSANEPAEGPGTVLGRYRLAEQIGEGGFGVVYLAEQREPVRRLVALKVLKPGMDSRQVLARFEAERQALALMDHPNIARVLDAGSTDQGRPYFVMELVKGVPITEYCDRARLTPRERLGLFVSVCAAVQHAHQKGVIHRDLKPSNVLVTLHDTAAVPKVIDFGIAKALHAKLTEQTLVTGFAQVVGTPLYMSPEQAEMNALGIDTRSDVYALGVLLYELLTGTTPFDKERLRVVSFDELRRILREEEPPRPSARVSTLGGAAATVSEVRRVDPGRLGRLLRGELDWVVMRCLEKDRERRYPTAEALARDVERYLADEPVEACPPSAGYRLRKFVSKHRRGLLTAAAFLGLLLAAGGVAGWQAVRLARADRDQADARARRSEEIYDTLSQVAELRHEARRAGVTAKWAEVRAMATRAQVLLEAGPVEPELAERVRALAGDLEVEGRDRGMAAELDEIRLRKAEVRDGKFYLAGVVPLYAEAFRRYGLDVANLEAAQAAARVRGSAIRAELLAGLDDWADLAPRQGPLRPRLQAVLEAADDNPWRRSFRALAGGEGIGRLLELARRPESLTQSPTQQLLLSNALSRAGKGKDALLLLRQAQHLHPADFWLNHDLGYGLLRLQGPSAEASGYLGAAVAARPGSPGARVNYGIALAEQGDLEGAAAVSLQAAQLDPRCAPAHYNLGKALRLQGNLDGALASLRRAVEIEPQWATALVEVGLVLRAKGDLDGAIATYRRAVAADPDSALAHMNLGVALHSAKDLDGAVAAHRKSLAIDPGDERVHVNLGNTLSDRGDAAGAAAAYRAALQVKPNHAPATTGLGRLLAERGDWENAIARYRQAIAHDPTYATAHSDLGEALRLKGDMTGAIASFRKALALDGTLVAAHAGLAAALLGTGDADGAVTASRAALARKAGFAPALTVLGAALLARGDLDGAVTAQRQAVAADPRDAVGHVNLGHALRQRGDFAEALAALRKAHELGSRQRGWPHPTETWVRQAERLVELDRRLPAALEGRGRPRAAGELLEYALVCVLKKQYAAAAGFYADAFAADPKQAEDARAGLRYDAACAAARAGVGAAAAPNEEERGRWRRQASAWLRADLAFWSREVATATVPERKDMVGRLRHWQADPDLAGLRDAEALARLPADEAAAWRKFWRAVAELLASAGQAK